MALFDFSHVKFNRENDGVTDEGSFPWTDRHAIDVNVQNGPIK